LDGQIELEALRLYGPPEAAPAPLTGTPTVPVGVREFAAETALDLPSLAGGAVHLVDVTVDALRRARRGGLVQQHRARAGAQRLGWRLRLRRGNAVGAGAGP
jgi:hypothetical protein